MDALGRWQADLEAWALPAEILRAAPEDPYTFPDVVIMQPSVDPLTTPTGHRVLERAPEGSRLLDVGCGAGRISGSFTPTHDVVGVEPRPGLAEKARAVGLTVYEGRWPDAASAVGGAPVVLCTHVLYDVQQPGPFLRALHDAASERVVIELTDRHPWAGLTPLYQHLHGIGRPDGPDVDLLLDVVEQLVGLRPAVVRWSRPSTVYGSAADLVAQTRRMLCLGPDADPEIRRLLDDDLRIGSDGSARLPDGTVATIWWDVDR